MGDSDDSDEYQELAGVVAHGLLNTMSVIRGAAEILSAEWDDIAPDRRRELFQLIEVHSVEASESLVWIVQGLPREALAMLDELDQARDALPEELPRLRRRRADAG